MLKESEIVGRLFNLLQGITPPKQTLYYIRDSYNPAGKITGLEGPYTSEVNAKTAVSIILDMSYEERHEFFGFHIPANALFVEKVEQ